jgi:hypothetical protein
MISFSSMVMDGWHLESDCSVVGIDPDEDAVVAFADGDCAMINVRQKLYDNVGFV